jgi:ATP-dependent HslUV protease ATP-binding subunit HslU
MNLDDMTPTQIVAELDKYIIGQNDAKRSVAIALRNRTRRKRLDESIRDEVTPKNIIMIGPTGVGKTEIARRISKIANTPFIKVEATKYTEVGYVGRDVESMVRDLMASAIQMTRSEMAKAQEKEVEQRVEERLLDLLLPPPPKGDKALDEATIETREKFKTFLAEGRFEEREVELTTTTRPPQGIELFAGGNIEDLQETIQSLGSMFGPKGKKRRVPIKRAREMIREEETAKSVDQEQVIERTLLLHYRSRGCDPDL